MSSELSIDAVLQRIVEAAADLTGAALPNGSATANGLYTKSLSGASTSIWTLFGDCLQRNVASSAATPAPAIRT